MYIVFDIGGTKMRVAKSRDGHDLSEPVIVPTPKDPNQGLDKLITICRDLAGDDNVRAIAGGLPGVIHSSGNKLLAAANLPHWVNFNLVEPLSHSLGCEVILENDASLGGLGEATWGAGKDFQRVVYITIGTGLGGVWIVNGELPAHGSTEPGHHIIDYHTNSDWERLVDTAPTPQDQAHYVAVGLFNTLLFWPAGIVILGGGKTFHKGWTTNQVTKELENIRSENYFTPPKIVVAELGDKAGLYGALRLAQKVKPH